MRCILLLQEFCLSINFGISVYFNHIKYNMENVQYGEHASCIKEWLCFMDHFSNVLITLQEDNQNVNSLIIFSFDHLFKKTPNEISGSHVIKT